MSAQITNRANYWFSILTDQATIKESGIASVKVADGNYLGDPYRLLAVVPYPKDHFPQARHGEVGLLEGWTLAKMVNEIVSKDSNSNIKRSIIAIIDVPSQAYGRREEAFGIHQSLAAATAAYATARMAGHPVIGLIVGKAMSGAFLAHGYQANYLMVFDDKNVSVHAMGKESAARITQRTVEELDKLASSIPPMAYDIKSYAKLGLLEQLLTISNPDNASSSDIKLVKETLHNLVQKCRTLEKKPEDCSFIQNRLSSPLRSATVLVRNKMREEW